MTGETPALGRLLGAGFVTGLGIGASGGVAAVFVVGLPLAVIEWSFLVVYLVVVALPFGAAIGGVVGVVTAEVLVTLMWLSGAVDRVRPLFSVGAFLATVGVLVAAVGPSTAGRPIAVALAVAIASVNALLAWKMLPSSSLCQLVSSSAAMYERLGDKE